jgi:hypothetical protein
VKSLYCAKDFGSSVSGLVNVNDDRHNLADAELPCLPSFLLPSEIGHFSKTGKDVWQKSSTSQIVRIDS